VIRVGRVLADLEARRLALGVGPGLGVAAEAEVHVDKLVRADLLLDVGVGDVVDCAVAVVVHLVAELGRAGMDGAVGVVAVAAHLSRRVARGAARRVAVAVGIRAGWRIGGPRRHGSKEKSQCQRSTREALPETGRSQGLEKTATDRLEARVTVSHNPPRSAMEKTSAIG
jgi:hypothetical protein